MKKPCEICGEKLNRGGNRFCSNKCHGISSRSYKQSHPREWNIWNGMKGRCGNPKNPAYKNYGQRGITYDPKWAKFVGFWEDMQTGYKEHLTLERINVDGPYNKVNCTWIPKSEQGNNKRNTVTVVYEGKEKRLKELAKELEINYHTLYNRIFTYKMPLEIALQAKNMRGLSKKKLEALLPNNT